MTKIVYAKYLFIGLLYDLEICGVMKSVPLFLKLELDPLIISSNKFVLSIDKSGAVEPAIARNVSHTADGKLDHAIYLHHTVFDFEGSSKLKKLLCTGSV